MKTYKLLLLLIIAIALSACHPLVPVFHIICKFYNNSDKDIYIVIETNTDNQYPSPGSKYRHLPANDWMYIASSEPWVETEEIVKDSIYLYILDASVFTHSPYWILSEEDCEAITRETILDKKTIYHEDLHRERVLTLSYP